MIQRGGGAVLAIVSLCACLAGERHKVAVREPHGDDSQIAPEARSALFSDMVALVRRFHVFSRNTQRNLGRRWDDDLPALQREFDAAGDIPHLLPALHHFVNALHDAHCRYRPREQGRSLQLGFTVGVEWRAEKPIFYVNGIQSDSIQGISEGDVVIEADGTPSATLLEAHSFVSNRNSWRSIALDVAQYLTKRREDESLARAGTPAHFKLERRNGQRYELDLVWRPQQKKMEASTADDDAVRCGPSSAKHYGAYALKARGARFCLYTSSLEPYRSFPIVRQFSFDYPEHLAREDHDKLRFSLASLSNPKGVILDLRENRGGNDQNIFLDWWASRPYTDSWTIARLDPELNTPDALARFATGMAGAHADFYIRSLDRLKQGERFSSPRPFMCRKDTCDLDNTYTPSHQVTSLPVAVLVGPGCASSCDAFVFQFGESKFGPLVGEPPASGFTTHRLKYRIPFHLDLGAFDMALTYDISGRTGEELEGRSCTIDYPVDRTRENDSLYDRVLVDGAIRSFHEYTFH